MKKLIKIIFPVACVIFIITACKKGSNNVAGPGDLGIGSYLVLDEAVNLNINYTDLANSKAAVKVHKYASGEEIDKVMLFASPGSSSDPTKWKEIKTVSYTGEQTELSVTGAELNSALLPNDSLTPGRTYTIFTRVVTKSGKMYDINNAGDNGGGGLVTGAFYKSVFSIVASVVCPFEQDASIGTYSVVSDPDWVDFSSGDQIDVTVGPNGHSLAFKAYPSPAAGGVNRQDWILDIDPTTGAATMAEQYVGDYGAGGPKAKCTATGLVFSCTGVISLQVDIDYGGTVYPGNRFVLKHN
jgi:hypothetical protein